MISQRETILKTQSEADYLIHTKRDADPAAQKYNDVITMLLTLDSDEFSEKEVYDLLKTIRENLALCYFYQEEFGKAHEEIATVRGTYGPSTLCFIIEGHILYNELEYDKSLKTYNDALSLIGTREDHPLLPLALRGKAYALYQLADSHPNNLIKSRVAFEKALDLFKARNRYDLEHAITIHGFARLLVKMQFYNGAESWFNQAITMASDFCGNENTNYDIAIMKRSLGEYFTNYCPDRFEKGVALLLGALDVQMNVYENKPHQSILGTMAILAKLHRAHPNHVALKDAMSLITTYANNWPTLCAQNSGKQNINVVAANDKIATLLNKPVAKKTLSWCMNSFWQQQSDFSKAAITLGSAAVCSMAAISALARRR